jgi:SprT protein
MTLPLIISISKIKKQAQVPPNLRHQCQARIEACWSIAKEKGISPPLPTLSFDLRGKTAGKAYLTKNHIQLNPILLIENEQSFIARTVGHEAAHLIARHQFGLGIQGHGPEWATVMGWLGQEASRCHSFDTKNASVIQKPFTYSCDCTPARFFSKRRHLKLMTSPRSFICPKCRSPLQWKEPTSNATTSGVIQLERKPSSAMLRYAQTLALRHKIELPPDTLNSFVAAFSFIETYKVAPPVCAPASALVPVIDDLPTARQAEFARALAKRNSVQIPALALQSKRNMSQWISEQVQRTS